jgi:hypothetical protein
MSKYLNKYIANTDENYGKMKEKYRQDTRIFELFPFFSINDDKDFHIFYEFINNTHLFEEKRVHPFENAKDYCFLYWFLDEILPRNWDRLRGDKEKNKFRDGHYLNMLELVDSEELYKFDDYIRNEGLPRPIEKTSSHGDWVKWKQKYSEWRELRYRKNPKEYGERESVPKGESYDRESDEDCKSLNKQPEECKTEDDYKKQAELFSEEKNKKCPRDAKTKKMRLDSICDNKVNKGSKSKTSLCKSSEKDPSNENDRSLFEPKNNTDCQPDAQRKLLNFDIKLNPSKSKTPQNYPPGTPENLMMGKGKKSEFPEGRGGGKGEPGVPPKTLDLQNLHNPQYKGGKRKKRSTRKMNRSMKRE